MSAYAIARSTAQADAFPAHFLPAQDDFADRLTPPEEAIMATIEYLLVNGLAGAVVPPPKIFSRPRQRPKPPAAAPMRFCGSLGNAVKGIASSRKFLKRDD